MGRPDLSRGMSPEDLRNNYYLKSELAVFCRSEGICAQGGKPELTERIAHYLVTGEELPPERKKRPKRTETLSVDAAIEENIVCSESHRAFFKSQIGDGFKFNVEFLRWLRDNPGRTYGDAVEQFHIILERKKTEKSSIGRQFEYNRYIRDFFEDNKGMKLEDAIKCWRYKKSIPGHNRYERSDKAALEK